MISLPGMCDQGLNLTRAFYPARRLRHSGGTSILVPRACCMKNCFAMRLLSAALSPRLRTRRRGGESLLKRLLKASMLLRVSWLSPRLARS